jgi:hypothetical protein
MTEENDYAGTYAGYNYHFIVGGADTVVGETETSSASGSEWVDVIATFKP